MTANLSRAVAVLRKVVAATAASMLLGLMPGPAQAQYYDYSGEVGTFPFNFFPIDPAVSFYDMTGNGMVVGGSGFGSFSMYAGAWLKVDTLNLGTGGTANGDVSVSGASTRLELGGAGGYRLGIGNWGTGSMTVSAGALVDAALPPSGCVGAEWWCGSVVGAGAGSTGTLTVTGSGSELRTLRSFVVGNAWVNVDTGFGTPGGTTNATVNVLDGGTLRTEQAVISTVPGGPGALGTEGANSNVTIDGAGSRWIVTRNSVDNGSAFLSVGDGSLAWAQIKITNDGNLTIDGAGSIGPFDGLQLGTNRSLVDMTVSGVGSAVEIKSGNAFINAGISGGEGRLFVQAGATVSSMFLNVGRDAGLGVLSIDGAGSMVTLSGVGTPGVAGAAGASIGRDHGYGYAYVRNGGRWLITDGGADSRPNVSSPGMSVGWGAGGTGSLEITGAGSTVEIVSNTLGLGAGIPDNYNAGLTLGRDAGGNGMLTVANGGKLLLTGNAVSTVTDSRTTFLNIGGQSDVAAGGSGWASVIGLGSEIRISGSDAFIGIGRAGSIGQLDIADKGLVASTIVNVGRVGLGTLTLNDATLELSGQHTGNVLSGAALAIGNRGGTGIASLANGSRVTLTNLGTSGAGLYLGGTVPSPLGTGSLSMTGGSRIEIVAASGLATLSVGHDGSGTVMMDEGSSIDIGNGSAFLGRTATGVGIVTLRGASTLNAGYVGIGATPGVDTGTGFLNVSDGSTVNAGTVEIGARGLLGGNGGTINADVIIGGAVNPGESPGRIRFNGFVSARPGGTLMLDILANGEDSFTAVARGFVNPQGVLTPGYDIDQLVIGAGSNFDFSGLTVAMNFLDATNLIEFEESGGLDLDNFMRSADGDTETGLSLVFPEGVHWTDVLANASIVAWTSDEAYVGVELEFTGSSEGLKAVVVLVPEPATWAFMLLGLCLLGVLARSRQRSARRALQPAAGARGTSVAARTHLCRVAS